VRFFNKNWQDLIFETDKTAYMQGVASETYFELQKKAAVEALPLPVKLYAPGGGTRIQRAAAQRMVTP